MNIPVPKKRLSLYQLFAMYVAVYLLILLLMKPNPDTVATYHLTTTSYRTLLFAASALPAMLVWFAAFYGYEQLRLYTRFLPDSKDGEGFKKILSGMRWLSILTPIPTIIALLLSAIANVHPGFRGASIVLSTYLLIIFALLAFTTISTGCRWLADLEKARPEIWKIRLSAAGFIVMGVLYCYFVLKQTVDGETPYHLSPLWLALTVIIPFFFAWFMGLLAVLDLEAYATKVSGLLYRRALRYLSGGWLVVISSSIIIQYINSANPIRGRLVLSSVLIVRYVFYICLIAGFVLIANGAKKLQQIEKI